MEGTREEESIIRRSWEYLVQNKLLVACLGAVGLGIGFGMAINNLIPLSEVDKLYVTFPGEVLVRMLHLVTLPLIVTSVIRGASRPTATSRKIALRAAVYFFLTTFASVTIGLSLILVVRPGFILSEEHEREDGEEIFSLDAMLDLVRNALPDNLIQACLQKYKTEKLEIESHTFEPNSSVETNATEVHLMGRYVDGANTLGLIANSFVIGLILKKIGGKGEMLVDVFAILNENMKYGIGLILYYLPIGVMFLTVSHVFEVHDWFTMIRLWEFMAVVVVGLIIQGGIVLPALYLVCVRRNPWAAIKGFLPALKSAALTASSAATQPLTSRCCEEGNQIDRRITRFMLPTGTSHNMSGTVLYDAAAAIFITQLHHINLNICQIITIGATSAVCTIGAAGFPAVGAMTTIFVLTAVGLPAKEAAMLVVVEWLLDRCNTVVNVLGDCVGVAIVHQLSQNELEELEEGVQDRTRSAAERLAHPNILGSNESFYTPTDM